MRPAIFALVMLVAVGAVHATSCLPKLNNGHCPRNDSHDCLYPWGGANVCKPIFANCIGAAMAGQKAKVQRCPKGQLFNVYLHQCSTTCDPPSPPGKSCTALRAGNICPTNDNHNCLYPVAGQPSRFANCQGVSMAGVPAFIQACNPGTPTFNFKLQNCI